VTNSTWSRRKRESVSLEDKKSIVSHVGPAPERRKKRERKEKRVPGGAILLRGRRGETTARPGVVLKRGRGPPYAAGRKRNLRTTLGRGKAVVETEWERKYLRSRKSGVKKTSDQRFTVKKLRPWVKAKGGTRPICRILLVGWKGGSCAAKKAASGERVVKKSGGCARPSMEKTGAAAQGRLERASLCCESDTGGDKTAPSLTKTLIPEEGGGKRPGIPRQ